MSPDDTNLGSFVERDKTFTTGLAGSVVMVRVRVAFWGRAGDVDSDGNPIKWNESWEKWLKPPAKYARATVGA